MSLEKKKELAKRTFGVGKDRIVFIESRLDDIKEAITKQDMRDLKKEGAIIIKPIGGRRTVQKRKSRSAGNIRKIARNSKREYVILTRKLRKHAAELRRSGTITKENFIDLRKKIRNKAFRSKAHFKEHMGGTANENPKKKKKK